jgi:hypothetical protein
MEDDMNRHECGDPLEWETVTGGSTPLHHHSDTAFDLRNMLVAAGQVSLGPPGKDSMRVLRGENSPSAWTVVMRKEVILVDLLEGLEKLGYGSVCKVVDCRETYRTTQC